MVSVSRAKNPCPFVTVTVSPRRGDGQTLTGDNYALIFTSDRLALISKAEARGVVVRIEVIPQVASLALLLNEARQIRQVNCPVSFLM
jgi:hypothetical protein